jgi:hypothetical protein
MNKQKLKKYLNTLRQEKAMAHACNGWYNEWILKKIAEVELKLQKLED